MLDITCLYRWSSYFYSIFLIFQCRLYISSFFLLKECESSYQWNKHYFQLESVMKVLLIVCTVKMEATNWRKKNVLEN